MFTGIIQTIGKITAAEKISGDIRLTIAANGLSDETIELGDSIACNGVCLTVIEQYHSGKDLMLKFDVSQESIAHSLIADWQANTAINMELAMLPTTRFGGHIVSGHVDGVGEIAKMKSDARSWRIWFKAPSQLIKYIAAKGSITIDGISLTVNGIENDVFHVNIVPHTMQVTTMGERQQGDKVHLEIDVVARYLERLLQDRSNGINTNTSSGITESLMQEHGFMK